MSKTKTYKHQEPEHQTVNEAAMMYETPCHSADDFVASLPQDVMHKLIDFALEEHRAGHCIPHSQVEEIINRRMKWE